MGIPVPISAGIRMDGTPAVRVEYPVNMVWVPAQGDTAEGYLRPAEGITTFASGQGFDRGALTLPLGHTVGSGTHFRVSGTKLISISATGVVTVIGDVGGTSAVRMTYSFDRVGILSNGFLWYWNGATLIKVTDPNIPANLVDMVWIDGYWLVTDGTDIAASTLADPTIFNAAKFGGTDRPSPIKALLRVLNELHVVSRGFIDVFQNVGGTGFPFQRVNNAVVTKGAMGTRAACIFNDQVAFVGGSQSGDEEESPSVYVASNARTVRISTTEIDKLLAEYTTTELQDMFMESVFDQGGKFLFIHLPDRTIVYDSIASTVEQQPVWHVRVSAITGHSRYKARNIVRFNDLWVVGDSGSTSIGLWSNTVSSHFGSDVRWEFSTPMLRNSNRGATINSLELLALPGSVALGVNPVIATAYSADGRTFSQDKFIESGKIGDTTRKLIWWRQGTWRRLRIQRFRGDSKSRLSVLALDAEVKPLRY